MFDAPVLVVFTAALVTAVATGLGALPFLLVREFRPRWLALANGAAAGLMLAASYGLIVEGFDFDSDRTLLGVVAGLALIVAADRILDRRRDVSVAEVAGADARRILLIVGIMTLHSAAEGVGVGVAYGGGRELGDFITAAIALHNVPEGLAISLVMVPRGSSVASAAGWSVFSSLPQPALAVPAFLFVLAFQPWLPVGLGLAAGAMFWMVFAELIPEANDAASPEAVGIVVTLAFALMLAAQTWLGG